MSKYADITGQMPCDIDIDKTVEKIMAILMIFPRDLKFSIIVLQDADAIQAKFKELFNIERDYISFYDPKSETVYLSGKDANERISGHEISHAVIGGYFKLCPPSPTIHELLAKYAEDEMYGSA